MEHSLKSLTPVLATGAAAAVPQHDAAIGSAAARKKAPVLKRSSAQAPSERSSDSSPVSGVSVASKGFSRSTLVKDSDVISDAPSPISKRHCSDTGNGSPAVAGLKEKWSPQHSKGGESDITSGSSPEGMHEAVVDPSGTSGDDTDPVSWPASALDFNLDQGADVETGEIEDPNVSTNLRRIPQQKATGPSAQASKDSLKVAAKDIAKDTHHDTQSESVVVASDAPEASDQQGTEGTCTSSGKGGKASPPGKRKVKVDWTPELHRRFVQAVEQLGVEKAIPSRILELMGVKCLTRHNIASHLQKYRSHRRHLAAREAEAANWQQQRKAADASLWPSPVVGKPGSSPFGWAPYVGAAAPGAPPPGFAPGVVPAGPVPGRPVMGMPPPGMAQGMAQGLPHPMGPHMPAPVVSQPQPGPMGAGPAIGMPMHVWGHPTMDHSQGHMWQRPGAMYPMAPPPWYGPDGSLWHFSGPFQQAPAVDMWGHLAAVPGYPGGGMVSGTPCFPPQMMPMPGAPQRIPSGISTSGPAPVPARPLPASGQGSAPASTTPSGTQASATPSTAGPCMMVASTAAANGEAPASGQGGQVSVVALNSSPASEDSFLDEPLLDCMFSASEDLLLNFSSGTCEHFSELQTSSALDAAISEALANPATPLPLGLNPPAVEGVLEELNRQGITMLPPLKGSGFGPLDIKSGLLEDVDLLGEVDDQALMLGDDLGEDVLSDDALKALLNP